MRIVPSLLLAVLAPLAAATAQPDEIEYDDRFIDWQTYREARERSRAEQKPLLLHFELDSDGRSRRMNAETYRDLKVIRYLNRHFTMARVDVERLPSLAEKYGVDGLPTIWFVDSDGRRLTHISGFFPPERLLPLLEFIHTRAFETWDYQNWLDRRK